jgi:hypothetical protein
VSVYGAAEHGVKRAAVPTGVPILLVVCGARESGWASESTRGQKNASSIWIACVLSVVRDDAVRGRRRVRRSSLSTASSSTAGTACQADRWQSLLPLRAVRSQQFVLTTVPDGSWCISQDLARWRSGRVSFSMDGEGSVSLRFVPEGSVDGSSQHEQLVRGAATNSPGTVGWGADVSPMSASTTLESMRQVLAFCRPIWVGFVEVVSFLQTLLTMPRPQNALVPR